MIVSYTGKDSHMALIQHGASIGAAKLWYDKPKKQFYLLVSLEIEGAKPTPQTHNQVVGVDVGQRYLAVTATPKNDASFDVSSDEAKAERLQRYSELRWSLDTSPSHSTGRGI